MVLMWMTLKAVKAITNICGLGNLTEKVLSALSVPSTDMKGSTFAGAVNMEKLVVEGELSMAFGANFKQEVVLRGAKVAGLLSFSGADFEAALQAATR